MSKSNFYEQLIKENLLLIKNKTINSLFEKTLINILQEEDLNTTPTPTAPANETPETEETALPQSSDLALIDLIELAVAALFTEMSKITEKNSEAKFLESQLSKIRPITNENNFKALELCQKLISMNDIPTKPINHFKEMDYATRNVLINLVVNTLFASKDQMLKSDPSLAPLVENIASDSAQLKNIKDKDPINALKLAEKIKNNLSEILPTINFTV